MQTVLPPTPRYRIEDSGNHLKITPGDWRYDRIGRIAFAVLLIAWVVFGVYVVPHTVKWVSQTNEPEVPIEPIYFLPMGLWLFFGVIWLFAFLWRSNFKEEVHITVDSISVQYKSIWFRHSRRYLAEDISDLRASPVPPSTLWAGTIAFDYGGRTFHFGSRISEAEAKQVVAAIQQKFPQYQTTK